MKLWLTAPYDPDGIEEIEATWGPDKNGHFAFNNGRTVSSGWYVEGHTFHRNRKTAIKKAREHRAKWLAKTEQAASTIASLPPIN